jgi:hypothetical protein
MFNMWTTVTQDTVDTEHLQLICLVCLQWFWWQQIKFLSVHCSQHSCCDMFYRHGNTLYNCLIKRALLFTNPNVLFLLTLIVGHSTCVWKLLDQSDHNWLAWAFRVKCMVWRLLSHWSGSSTPSFLVTAFHTRFFW